MAAAPLTPGCLRAAAAYALASRKPAAELWPEMAGFARKVAAWLDLGWHDCGGGDEEALGALTRLCDVLEDVAPNTSAHADNLGVPQVSPDEFGDAVSRWAARHAQWRLARGERVPLAFLEWIEAENGADKNPDKAGGPDGAPRLVLHDIPVSNPDFVGIADSGEKSPRRGGPGPQFRLVCALLDAAPREEARAYLDRQLAPGPDNPDGVGVSDGALDMGTAAAAELWRVAQWMEGPW